MAKTKIAWAEEVWNPMVGCTRVSAGCQNCYAERMAKRLEAMGRPEYQGLLTADGRWNTHVRMIGERLQDPLRWKKPRRVFVDSMSDLFHEEVPFEFIDEVFHTMRVADQHIYMILTKRPARMLEFIHWQIENMLAADKLWSDAHQNVWLGVSVEDQKTADERIPLLLQTPPVLRFVSAEPLLGPVDLMLSTWFRNESESKHKLPPNGIGLDWIICGGESGSKARFMSPVWARWLLDQCLVAGVPFFFKQWGEWIERDQWISSGHTLGDLPNKVYVNDKPLGSFHMFKVGKKAAGNLLDGRTWEERP